MNQVNSEKVEVFSEKVEIKSRKIKLDIDGKDYILRLPTTLEYIDYREEQKEAAEDERKIYKSISKFLDNLGMPSEDLDKMESIVLHRILEEIAKASSKKI